jgi:hypothetical protein
VHQLDKWIYFPLPPTECYFEFYRFTIDITSLSQSGHNDLYSLMSKLVAEPLITKVKDRVAETHCTDARGYNCIYWNHGTCLC